MTREQYVLMGTTAFVAGMREQTTLEHLEEFVDKAEVMVHEKSRVMTTHCLANELALTNHASHIRMMLEKLRELRDELIPALKIKADFWKHLQAVRHMGFIRAECEAMDYLIV